MLTLRSPSTIAATRRRRGAIAAAAGLLLAAALLTAPSAGAAPAAVGAPAARTVTNCPPGASPAAAVIRWNYYTTLERCADSAGAAYWQQQLVTGQATPGSIETALQLSAEDLTKVINPIYVSAFHRLANAGELRFWEGYLRGTHRLDVFYANLLAAAEPPSSATDTQYIQFLYNIVLGRAADAGGLSYWEDYLAGGGTREQAADSLYNSLEASRRQVSEIYHLLLGRPGDTGGLAYWSAWLSQHKDPFRVFASFANTAEFTAYASTNPAAAVD